MAFKSLKPEHYIAIEYLSQPKYGGKTHEEIAKECGVHRATIFEWKKDPLFERELKKEMVRKSRARIPEILESIPDHIINDGNAAMLKTFLQMHDMLTERHAVDTSVDNGSNDIDELRAKVEEYKKRGQAE
jgi:hypothetical protein